MEGKGEQRMMKKYKAKKATIKVVRITDDVSFYENPWIKKTLCIDVEGRFYIRESDGRIWSIPRKGFLCKRKDGGADFYESEEFLAFYEEA